MSWSRPDASAVYDVSRLFIEQATGGGVVFPSVGSGCLFFLTLAPLGGFLY